MSCWEILGIAPTNDKEAIREAYMEKIPLYHPEDAPEGFRTLREAYESAMRAEEVMEEVSEEETSPVKTWIAKIDKLYDSFFERIEEKNWLSLLNEEVCYQIGTSKEVSEALLAFLMNKYYLPCKIWSILDEHFSWSQQKEELYERFPVHFINFVFSNISKQFRLRYELFEKDIEIPFDEWIGAYYDALYELRENNIYDAKKHLEKMLAIYQGHPDLILLEGRYYLTTNHVERAIELFSKVISQNAEDIEAHLNRADAFLRLGRVDEAYDDNKKAFQLNGENMRAIYGFAECAFSLKNFKEAKELLDVLTYEYPYDGTIRAKFHSANNYLIEQYEKKQVAAGADLSLKLELGECYFNTSHFEKAKEMLESIAKGEAAEAKACWLYGDTLKALKDEEQAEIYLDKAIALNSKQWQAYYTKGLLFHDRKNYQEAVFYYDKAIELNKKMANLYSTKGNALCELKRFEEALETCEKALEVNPNLAHAHNNRAWALYGLGAYEEALEACDTALNIYAYFTGPYVNKVKVYYELSKYEDVISVCDKALEHRVADSRIYQYKGAALRALGELEAAKLCYNKSLELDQEEVESCYGLGVIAYRNEDYDKAIEMFDKVIVLAPNSVNAYIKRGEAYEALKDYEKAGQNYEEAISLQPDNINAHVNRGNLYNAERQYKETIAYFTKLIDRGLESRNFYNGRAIAYEELEQYDEAMKDYKKSIETDDEFSTAYFNLADLYAKLKNYDEAIDCCEKGLDIEPDSHYGNRVLGDIYHLLKQYDKAIEYFTISIGIDSDCTICLMKRAEVYEDKGNNLKAKEDYKAVLEIDPEHEKAKERLKALKKK